LLFVENKALKAQLDLLKAIDYTSASSQPYPAGKGKELVVISSPPLLNSSSAPILLGEGSKSMDPEPLMLRTQAPQSSFGQSSTTIYRMPAVELVVSSTPTVDTSPRFE
jgi:hypothetical protein